MTASDPSQRPTRFAALEMLLRRLGLSEYAIFLVLAALAGLITGVGVIAFRALYEGITEKALGSGHLVLEAIASRPAWQVVAVPALGGLLVGLIVRLMPSGASGEHGVARVIFAVARNEGRVPFHSTVRSFLTNAVSIGAGGSVGPEGPVVELGAGLGSAMGQWLRLSPERVRTLVGCGAAAGLSAAFNAPIAGAIFALEIVLRDFAVITFSPIIVASVLATAVSRAVLGDDPAFVVPVYELRSVWELPLYVLLGVVAGVGGVLFTRTTHAGEHLSKRIPGPTWLRPMFGGLVLGLIFAFALPELFGVGYEPMGRMLEGHMALTLLLVLIVAKSLATSFTLSTGFTGGIFAPTLMVGGALGGAIGQFAGMAFPEHAAPVGAYSLVGMAAFMAAVTHAPMTSILILFEMTGGYEVILPLMTACICSLVVAQRIAPESMFTLGLARRGIDLNFGRESAILRDFYAEDLMHPDLPKIDQRTDLQTILDRFLEHREDRYWVVDDAGWLQGEIDLHDLKEIVREQGLQGVVIAADLMHPVPHVVQRRENLEDTIMVLSSADADELPVVQNHETPVLLGTISRRDILELYNREILHKEVLGIKLVHRDTKGTDFVDLPEQYRVGVLDVIPSMAGQSLQDLDLRGRFNVHVLAIKRPGLRAQGRNELPDPRVALTKRDRLIVVGRSEDVDRLKESLEAMA